MKETAKHIVKTLEAFGFSAYLVGGCVRDTLLNLPVKDYDIATSASVAQVGEVFAGAKPVASASGAPVCIVDGIEVATFRSDEGTRGASEAFRPGTLMEDSHRRDFTVNALYQGAGEVLDPTGQGLQDLQAKRLAFIGNADRRIQEDATRILRAYRFALTKGLSFADETAQALRVNAHLLGTLAEEQKGRELVKILQHENPKEVAKTFAKMQANGVLEFLLPEVSTLAGVEQNEHHLEGDAFDHTLLVLAHSGPSLVARFAALLHDIGKAPSQAPRSDGKGNTFHGHEAEGATLSEGILLRLGCTHRRDRERIVWLVENHMRIHNLPSTNRKKQAQVLRHDGAKDLLSLCWADTFGRLPLNQGRILQVLRTAEEFYATDKRLSDLQISARTLIAGGEVPGKKLGVKLLMMQAILDKDPSKTRKEILASVGH